MTKPSYWLDYTFTFPTTEKLDHINMVVWIKSNQREPKMLEIVRIK